MTPEQIEELKDSLQNTLLLIPMKGGGEMVTELGTFAVDAITQLQEQKHGLEQYIEGQKLDIQGLQEQLNEYKDAECRAVKSEGEALKQNANYKEQITALVKKAPVSEDSEIKIIAK